MASQPSDDSLPAPEVKNEKVLVAEINAVPSAVTEPVTASRSTLMAPALTKKDYEMMNGILHRLTNYRDLDGHDVSKDFQRVVNRRVLPDYHDIIKEPMAFSTIRAKLLRKQYHSFKGFVRDFAMISHNAQVYNRPSALVYADSITLQELFKAELRQLVEAGSITVEDAQIPYLGEIPEVEDSPPPEHNDEEMEEEEEEEDDEEDDDETDDDRPRRVRKKGRRSSAGIRRDGKAEDGNKDDPESQKKRGRPPKVHTPMEARINTLLKGLRKFKNSVGELKILPFEKLPDKTQMPEYYQEIKQPIAMDLIKRKAKRKKYHSVDQALKDLELMFDNAKLYNLEDSQVYKDAVDLQREARLIAEQEKKKPDSYFVDEDGRLPLPEILHKGELWKVGDWIHLTNTNDVTKPIVAQIYRTWQDPEGQKWINACWYYRPEQTVHNHEKHFYENEVVKTGQYRDHKIEEVVDRCFVMFFTRYNKGRPRGFSLDKEVYVCEARYNEEKFKLNKIKTWASCVPDEVREKDYEMDLFDSPKKMKKVPSPIKHLLREDAKEDDPLPKPTWGAANAPPIVGAVHKRPRGPNESPPPERTPSPLLPPSPEPVRRPLTADRPRYDSQGSMSMPANALAAPLTSPLANQIAVQTPYNPRQPTQNRPSASPAPIVQQSSYGPRKSSCHTALPQTPVYPPQNNFAQYPPATASVHQQANPLNNYNQYQNSSTNTPRPTPASSNSHSASANMYNPPKQIEVYTLPDAANSSIPADIRSQFHHDELGRVLFFTAPPLDVDTMPGSAQSLGHSLRYLADKARRREEYEKKRKARDARLELVAAEKLKRLKTDADSTKEWINTQKIDMLLKWCSESEKWAESFYKRLYDENWKEIRERELSRLSLQQHLAYEKHQGLIHFTGESEHQREVKMTGFRWV